MVHMVMTSHKIPVNSKLLAKASNEESKGGSRKYYISITMDKRPLGAGAPSAAETTFENEAVFLPIGTVTDVRQQGSAGSVEYAKFAAGEFGGEHEETIAARLTQLEIMLRLHV